jgi:hypothetical protein
MGNSGYPCQEDRPKNRSHTGPASARRRQRGRRPPPDSHGPGPCVGKRRFRSAHSTPAAALTPDPLQRKKAPWAGGLSNRRCLCKQAPYYSNRRHAQRCNAPWSGSTGACLSSLNEMSYATGQETCPSYEFLKVPNTQYIPTLAPSTGLAVGFGPRVTLGALRPHTPLTFRFPRSPSRRRLDAVFRPHL